MERRNMKRVSPLLLVLGFGFMFASYNILCMAIRSRSSDSGNGGAHRSEILDLLSGTAAGSKFHVALTATNASYSQWLCRIMFYWYTRTTDMPGLDSGEFARSLHFGKPDNLMEEIPTFVVDPLPQGLDRGYAVLDRLGVFVQWLETASIKEEYVLMAEPDHIIVRPLPNLAQGETRPAGFPFFYIKPEGKEKIVRKFYHEENGPVTNVDPIGNSPVIIDKALLLQIAPIWMNVSLRMKDDPEQTAFGWSHPLYTGAKHVLRKDFLLQPPWDLEVGNKFIIHYTYGCDYNMKGELTYGKIGEWRCDKRSYFDRPPPRNLSRPPPGVPESVVRLVKNGERSYG